MGVSLLVTLFGCPRAIRRRSVRPRAVRSRFLRTRFVDTLFVLTGRPAALMLRCTPAAALVAP
jgi:hypothetical protein